MNLDSSFWYGSAHAAGMTAGGHNQTYVNLASTRGRYTVWEFCVPNWKFNTVYWRFPIKKILLEKRLLPIDFFIIFNQNIWGLTHWMYWITYSLVLQIKLFLSCNGTGCNRSKVIHNDTGWFSSWALFVFRERVMMQFSRSIHNQ